METIIKWNADIIGVEIQTNNQHFVISGQPSMATSWHEAVRFFKENKVWQLPTRDHLKLIAEHIDEVNTLIRENGGCKIQGWHWTADEYDEFCAWTVLMNYGLTYNLAKNLDVYVRAVSAFQN